MNFWEEREKLAKNLGLREAKEKHYIEWLIGFLNGGGKITHEYNYSFPEFFIAKKDAIIPAKYGSASYSIIVPEGIKIEKGSGGGCVMPWGHNEIFFMKGFITNSLFWVPVYSGMMEKLNRRMNSHLKGALSLNPITGGELSKVKIDGSELSIIKK